MLRSPKPEAGRNKSIFSGGFRLLVSQASTGKTIMSYGILLSAFSAAAKAHLG
jgi:hypothetical protein